MTGICRSMEELIGHTPILELTHIEKTYHTYARILAKLECYNATGSAKDRIAKHMIDDAEEKGILKQGSVIIEPTSGNTGIGLAAVGTTRGYRVMIVMPDTMSVERRKLMKAYGAELVLSDGSKGMSGAIAKAQELQKEIPNAWIAGQFDNPANWEAHFRTTGPEIWDACEGNLDVLVAGVGTGGTLTGTGKYLKKMKSDVDIVAVEPDTSPVLSEGKAGPHGIQGIGAGFIPTVLDTEIYDRVIRITDEEAYRFGAEVGAKEGVLVGISSGAALCGALKLACRKEYEGKTIVVVFPDSGDRYLSTQLFTE